MIRKYVEVLVTDIIMYDCKNRLPSDFELLGVFIDECIPSKIFKMASNSFEVTDVPF